MISKDELKKAISYTFQSPFVRKIVGVTQPELQEHLDEETSKEINDSAHLLSTTIKEHQNAKNTLSAAYDEDSTQYAQAFIDYIQSVTDAAQEKVDAAQRALDEMPKRDESFIADCSKEEKTINEEREKEKQKVIAQRLSQLKGYALAAGILAGLFIPFPILGYYGLIDEMRFPSRYHDSEISALRCLIIFGIIGLALMVYIMVRNIKKSKQLALDKVTNNHLDSIDKEYDSKIQLCRKKMERGYAEGSEFSRNLHMARRNLLLCKEEQEMKQLSMGFFAAKLSEGPMAMIDLLDKTIDNIDHLNDWAANYAHETMLKEHYSEMAHIEKEKLREQERTSRLQEESAKRHEELLRQQAEAAKTQAKDTEEIRKRLEREKYGELARPYAGYKFPWEE